MIVSMSRTLCSPLGISPSKTFIQRVVMNYIFGLTARSQTLNDKTNSAGERFYPVPIDDFLCLHNMTITKDSSVKLHVKKYSHILRRSSKFCVTFSRNYDCIPRICAEI